MIKLLVIAPQNPYPAKDGGKIGIYYPVIHLSKHFEVHFAFITPNVVSPEVYEHFRNYNVSIYPQIKDTQDSLFGYMANITSALPYKFQKYCSGTILERLEGICDSEKIDNIWCNHSHVAWYGLQLSAKRKVNIYLREHNIEYSLVHQIMNVQRNVLTKAFIKYQYVKTKRFEQQCWQKFSKTFFISDTDYAIAKDKDDGRFILLYDAFQQSRNTATAKIEPFSFIFTASLKTFQNQYNLQKFIDDIWKRLMEKDRKWKLYVTGNESDVLQEKIRADFQKLSIINLGFVEDIDGTIASKKYFISPTYMGSGIRIKVLNAMSAGAVCFITNTDLKMLSVLNDRDNILKFDDFEEFYSKLLEVEASNTLYNSISLHAKHIGTPFTWDKYAETVYNEVS